MYKSNIKGLIGIFWNWNCCQKCGDVIFEQKKAFAGNVYRSGFLLWTKLSLIWTLAYLCRASHSCSLRVPTSVQNRKKIGRKQKKYNCCCVCCGSCCCPEQKKNVTHLQINLIFGLNLPLEVQILCKLARQDPNWHVICSYINPTKPPFDLNKSLKSAHHFFTCLFCYINRA